MIDGPLTPDHNRLLLLKKELSRHLKRLDRKREKQQEELAETQKALWYRQIADSLSALPSSTGRGISQEILHNIHTGQDEIVPLNPKLTIRENVALLYKKAKKSERGDEVNAKKVAETDEEILTCKKLILLCESALAEEGPGPANDLIGQIESALAGHLPQSAPALSSSGHQEEKIPYRHYSIDGWDVYVGKNDRQNDELTTRFAKSNDLWLHVAGHAGSHLVIRRPDRTAQVPQEVVNKVASLAVWFSKAKHTSYAEVHVTEARFVRKRRHSPPGQVIAERCKAVRVSPKSPQEMFPGKYEDDGEE
jgi:predicted ribosome quality control (RQC) complex YloA/Tae2 family protein